jgi:hypothetical protein
MASAVKPNLHDLIALPILRTSSLNDQRTDEGEVDWRQVDSKGEGVRNH